MTKTSQTVVFFGNERLATGVHTDAPTLLALIKAGYDVRAIVVNNEITQSRKHRELEIETVAKLHNIPVHAPRRVVEIQELLEKIGADIGILAAYGKMVPQNIMDIFPYGIINIHPSLLPLHRGSIPIESVMLDGSTKTGVSIMQLVSAMDAGPVFAHSELTLTGDETKQALADTLLDIGGSMLLDILPGIFARSIVAAPQDESQATYDSLITKTDGILDFSKPALQLEREIRAFAEWPKSRTVLGSTEVTITKARVSSIQGTPGEITVNKDELLIHTAKESLAIEELLPAGKKIMPIQAFLTGYRSKIS